jgi:putative hydrolase of the HAD superfamily
MIFFDIDGTLIDHLRASAAASLALYEQFSGQIPFTREEFPAAWESIMDRHFNRFTRGEISLWDQRRARIRESFGAPRLSDAEADARYLVFIRDYEQLTRAYDDAVPCLERLIPTSPKTGEKRGTRLGIISNGAREQQLGKLRRAGLMKYFSVTVFSEDTGFGKPHPGIFQEACRRAGENPEECVHVGDDLTNDIHPSRALGIRPVWIDRIGGTENGVRMRRIMSLAELGTVLQEEEVPSHFCQNREEIGHTASRNS